MRITCSQSQLSKALGVVGRAAVTRTTMPVTGHVLLTAEASRLKLAATNLELAMVARLDAEVADEGAVSVPARLFIDLVNALPYDRVELTLDRRTQTLAIKAGRAGASVKGLDPSEFPHIDAVTAAALLEVPGTALRQAIEETLFAAARDETRPQLCGLLLRARGLELTLVGCDSFRLAVRRLTLPAPAAEDVDLIVPARALLEVSRVQGAFDEALHVAVTPNRATILFHASKVDVISRLIDGPYVEFQRVLDQAARHDVLATMTTAEVQRAARFTSFVARDANQALQLVISPSGNGDRRGCVTLQATAAQIGDNRSELDAMVEGGEAKLSLDNSYLIDALAAVHSERVSISVASGQTLPVLLRPVATDTAAYAIMPMHLQR